MHRFVPLAPGPQRGEVLPPQRARPQEGPRGGSPVSAAAEIFEARIFILKMHYCYPTFKFLI